MCSTVYRNKIALEPLIKWRIRIKMKLKKLYYIRNWNGQRWTDPKVTYIDAVQKTRGDTVSLSTVTLYS